MSKDIDRTRSLYRQLLAIVLLLVVAGLSALIAAPGFTASAPTTAAGSNLAQNNRKSTAPITGPIVVHELKHDVSPPLASIPDAAPRSKGEREREIRRHPPADYRGPIENVDSVVQRFFGPIAMPTPLLTFEGIDYDSSTCDCAPPDTNGDVGPNHYVQTVNTAYQIFDKSGTSLGPARAINTLWTGFLGVCEIRNDGDPIVKYDQLADRWVINQFTTAPPYTQCIAVSTTGDPNGSYHRYAFEQHEPLTRFGDYQKIGVWPDAYYMSNNEFSEVAFLGAGNYAFDRTRMLQGLSATYVYFGLPATNWGGQQPTDLDGPDLPPAGAPNLFVEIDDSAWDPPNIPTDQLQMWRFHVDFAVPANSTFTPLTPLTPPDLAAFDGLLCDFGDCVPQPGTAQKLDTLADRVMFRAAYRNFGTHQSVVFNHTVDTGTDKSAVRWYELRDIHTTPSLYQQGTYDPDTHHRWMASVAQDGQGNMAVGYSVSSSTLFPSIKYSGRLVSDPLNTLPQGEAQIFAGTGSQTGTNGRWGDYSSMNVDPVDDCTFWYTQEYYAVTDSFNWRTHVGSFKFPGCAPTGATATPSATGAATSTGTVVAATSTNTSVPPTSTNTAVASSTAAACSPVNLVLDDGTVEDSVGWTNSTMNFAAIWINRSSPPPSSFPMNLTQISIKWPNSSDLVGKTIALLVYVDADGDGDPADAVKVAQVSGQTISVADGVTFQNYPVNVNIAGPGDVYYGFSDTYNSGGVSPRTFPAPLDTTATQGRSFVAAQDDASSVDYDNLGNNDNLGTIDDLSGGALEGNWVIRASGTGGACPTGTATSTGTVILPTSTGTIVAATSTTTAVLATSTTTAVPPTPTQTAVVCTIQVVQDPSFEGGSPSSTWSEASTNFGTPLCNAACGSGGGTAGPRTGDWWAWFGGTTNEEDGSLEQTVNIPSGPATLNFYLWIGAHSGAGTADYFRVLIGGTAVFTATDADTIYDSGYTLVSVDVTAHAGGSRVLRLEEHNEAGTGVINVSVDDVTIDSGNACPTNTSVPASPTGTVPAATSTNTSIPTSTNTSVPATSTNTSVPATNTSVASATNTSVLATNTSVAATDTSVPATSTRTSTSVPSSTGTVAAATSTNTSVPATSTNTSVPLTATSTVAGATNTAVASATTVASSTAVASATATVCTINFPDNNPGDTFYEWIQCLACRGIVNGYPDGMFHAERNITRGQISKMVSNAAGFFEDPGPQIYDDVPPGSTYYAYINRLTNRGIMAGYPCPERPAGDCSPDNPVIFLPNANATRGQLSKIVSNAAGFDEAVTGQTYADVPPSGEGSQFYEWIMRLSNRGVMGGYECGSPGETCDAQSRPYFRWAEWVTRGQASKIVANTFFPNNCQPRDDPKDHPAARIRP